MDSEICTHVLLETVLGAGGFEGALLGVELDPNEIDGLRLGTELGAIDVEGRNEVDQVVLGTALGASCVQGMPTKPELSKVTQSWHLHSHAIPTAFRT